MLPHKLLPKLWVAVRRAHEDIKLSHGHNAKHAWNVAKTAIELAGDDQDLARSTCAAALCHNADHIARRIGTPPERLPGAIREMVEIWLMQTDLFGPGKDIVIDAVVNHSSPNKNSDDLVLVVLKDADRLESLKPTVTIIC